MIQTVIHIFLALLIFLSTTGVAVIRHFCHDHLRTVSVMVDTEACEMDKTSAVPTCHSGKPMSCCDKAQDEPLLKDHDCCSTQTVFLKLPEEFQLQKSNEMQVPGAALFSLPVFVSTVGFTADLHSHLATLIHSPPLFTDIPVLTGSFLL
ncbi:MAG: hypothetical protein WD077_11080 [Bacteroidia bacterium]